MTILTFRTKFAQAGYFYSKKRLNEHYHWILHIQISLSTKFQLKPKILIFFDQIYLKKGFLVLNNNNKTNKNPYRIPDICVRL